MVIDAPSRSGDPLGSLIHSRVLLVFEEGDESRPIIVGFVRDSLLPAPVREEIRFDTGAERGVVIDGERIVFEAEQEVLFRCGKSSIVMRQDGKVVVRGTDVLSRSSGSNRVKGASIKFN